MKKKSLHRIIPPQYIFYIFLLTFLPLFLFLSSCEQPRTEHPAVINPNIQVFFSPQGGCESAIINEINKAKTTIHIAMYSFTEGNIARAIVQAKERGVDVRIILDESQTSNQYSKKNFLLNRGLPLKTARGIGRGIMHNKFAIIDGKIVITGSFNWTASAEAYNYENLLIIDSVDLAKRFEEEFQRIYR